MLNEETKKLFGKFVDGRMSESEFTAFEQKLRESSELRSSYIRYAELNGLLSEQTTASQAETKSVFLPRLHLNSLWSFVGGAGLAAAVCFAIFWTLQSQTEGTSRQNLVRVPTPIFQTAQLKGQTSVAVLQAADCKLDGSLSLGDGLKPGIITLPEGRMSLLFGSGAEVLLHGPAKFHLLRETAATLVSGTAQIHLPHNSGKFVLNTPHSSHAQRFARYELAVNEAESLVQVHEGEVNVSRLDEEGFTYTSLVLRTSERLRASSDSLEKLESIDVEEEMQVTQNTSQDITPLAVSDRYVELVKQKSPLLYWRFEDESLAGGIKNEVSERNRGVPIHEGSELPFTPIGGALSFEESSSPRTVLSQDTIPNFLDQEFTIELWINQNDSSLHQSILSLGPAAESASREHYLLLEYIDDTALIVHPRRSFRYLFRNPAGRNHGINLFTRGGLSSRTWHHIVALKDSMSMKFYHNAQKVGESGAINREVQDELVLYLGQLRRRTGERPFCGRIDELAIYLQALTPAQIEEHYRAIVPAPAPPNADRVFQFD